MNDHRTGGGIFEMGEGGFPPPPNTSDDLVERCQELLDWSATGLLANGKGGTVRALAERLKEKIGEQYALNVAESQTKDEAMRAVISLRAEIERLRERCQTYKGQVKAGAEEIERLKAQLAAAGADAKNFGFAMCQANDRLIAAGDFADRLVDWVYLYATEGAGWPGRSTISEHLIALARQRAPTQHDADHFKSVGGLKALRSIAGAGK